MIQASQSTGSESLLLQADEKIYEIAERWGVQYVTISDLSSIGGSFCGVFCSESNGDSSPWIFVAIKG